jgi:MraZ protein
LAQNGAKTGPEWGKGIEQMFLDRFEHTIDDKGRLTIPARYRATLATGLVITRGIDRCLHVYPLVEWGQLAEKIHQLPVTNKPARRFARFMFSAATRCDLDKQGRVLIPVRLRAYAHLGDEVIVAGVNDHLEIWNRDAYQEENSELEQDPDVYAETLGELGIL